MNGVSQLGADHRERPAGTRLAEALAGFSVEVRKRLKGPACPGLGGASRPRNGRRNGRNGGDHDVYLCDVAHRDAPPYSSIAPCEVAMRGFVGSTLCVLTRSQRRPPGSRLVAFTVLDRQRATGRSSTPTALATRSKARLERPRSRRMNLVIVDAGTEAWPAIRRNGRPSVRMAARRESEITFRVMMTFLLPG